MSKVLRLNWRKLTKTHSETSRGVRVEMTTSAYDLPESASGDYSQSHKRFIIRLAYIGGDEPLIEGPSHEIVSLRIGRTSGRVYEIHIDVNRVGADEVSLQVLEQAEHAMKYLADIAPQRRQQDNLEAAREVLSSRGAELIGS